MGTNSNKNLNSGTPITMHTLAKLYNIPKGYKKRLGSMAMAEFYKEVNIYYRTQ